MDQYEQDALIFKAFCDHNRLRIMEQLQQGEVCACKLLSHLNIGQPTLSHHMKILVDSGLVQARKDGKWVHYALSKEGIEHAKERLDHITFVHGQRIDECICR